MFIENVHHQENAIETFIGTGHVQPVAEMPTGMIQVTHDMSQTVDGDKQVLFSTGNALAV